MSSAYTFYFFVSAGYIGDGCLFFWGALDNKQPIYLVLFSLESSSAMDMSVLYCMCVWEGLNHNLWFTKTSTLICVLGGAKSVHKERKTDARVTFF